MNKGIAMERVELSFLHKWRISCFYRNFDFFVRNYCYNENNYTFVPANLF